jgi:hypothetical protein
MVLEARFKPATPLCMERVKKSRRLVACLRSKTMRHVLIWTLLATNNRSMMLGDQLPTSTHLHLLAALASSQTEMFVWRSRLSIDPSNDQVPHLLHHQPWMVIPRMMVIVHALMFPYLVLHLWSNFRHLLFLPRSVRQSQHHSRLLSIALLSSHQSTTIPDMEDIKTIPINIKIFVDKSQPLQIGRIGSIH